MKKIFALLLMVIMSVTLLAGCGTDPVQADLENFLNVEMTEVNADYTKITEEVKAIKDKYVKVMETYKTGFEALSEGCETQEEATINAGSEKLEEAVGLLDEYNKALETIAAEYDLEVEY